MRRKVKIWSKILFTVFVAIVPTVAITLFSAYSFLRANEREAASRVDALRESFTNEQRLITMNALQTLLAISQTRSVQNKDYAYLSIYLRDLMRLYPDYAVLLAANEEGTVIASGVQKTGYSVADRDYLSQARHNRRFTLSGYIMSRSTGIPSMTYTLPVIDQAGDVVFLIATYSLEKYARELSLSRLGSASVLEIIDHDGLRLFTNRVGPGREVGAPVDEDIYRLARERSGAQPLQATIGEERVFFASGAVSENERSVYVAVYEPISAVYRDVGFPVARMVTMMALATLLAFAVSVGLARRLIVVRIERLTEQSRLLAAGDLSARLALNRARDEITDLIDSFNEMASSLEERSMSNMRALSEKESLLEELRKRVASNLQVMSSMVSLQADNASEDAVRRALTATQSRIMAMSLVYETIWRNADVSRVSMRRFATGLCDYLVSTYENVGTQVSCAVSGEDVLLSLDFAIPLALALNEIVTNCLVHAFPGRVGGLVRVEFSRGERARMTVVDDGFGFEATARRGDTLGYVLIEALADQLCGEVSVSSGPGGTTVVLSFPER